MTSPATNASSLPEYESVIAELVDELQQYKNAVTSLNDAVGASREIHARAKAVGMMTETVLDRADRILTELQELDTPSLIPRLAAMEEAVSGLSHRATSLQAAFMSLEKTADEVTRIAREATHAAETTHEAMTQTAEKVIDATNETKASFEAHRMQIAMLTESAVNAAQEAKNASDASLEAARTEIPSAIDRALQPITANLTRMTYFIYALLASTILLLIIMIAMQS